MSLFDEVAQHLGLVALTVISLVLVIYLTYSMLHPERY